MKTSTSAFLWPFKVKITSLAASSDVLGGGFASFQASINFLYLKIQKIKIKNTTNIKGSINF
jgi:hypothetical protein